MPRWAVLLAFTVCVATGCVHSVTRELVRPGDVDSLDHASPFLKAHMADGRAYVLSEWRVSSDSKTVSGVGDLLDPDRNPLGRGPVTIPVDSVALFETNVVRTHPAVSALGFVTAVSVIVTIACVTNPKACFGSCPTFYVTDGERDVLQAEGFSGSVSPSLEAADLDALPRARPRGREVRVGMRNEALETQVVRRVDLLAVPRPAGGRVVAAADGRFFATIGVQPPSRATAAEGDCRAAVAALDGVERSSAADSVDLAARETVELEFSAGEGPRGLVIGARQSLLGTYLFYQALAWMGSSAGEWFASLERGDPVARRCAGMSGRMLGGISVDVLDPRGAWTSAGEYAELGPIAADVQVVPLPERGAGPVRIRLTLTKGAWRLDEVALARLGPEIAAERLQVERVMRGDREDAGAAAALRGEGQPLVTAPGDAFTLVYRPAAAAAGCEFFLESRGYYIEWMRQEWLAEEDPARLALLFADPRGSLRRMAADYKRHEPAMEAAFWGSRYAHP